MLFFQNLEENSVNFFTFSSPVLTPKSNAFILMSILIYVPMQANPQYLIGPTVPALCQSWGYQKSMTELFPSTFCLGATH